MRTASPQVQPMLQRAGTSEQYLESYFLVEALELQLARLRQAPPAATAVHTDVAGPA